MKSPKKKLWIGPTHGIPEVELIFNQIDKLQYQDRPDYSAIENLLFEIYNKYEMNATYGINGVVSKWQLVPKLQPISSDLNKLKNKMSRSRQQDFFDYFNNHKLLAPTRPVPPNIQGAHIPS